MTTPPVDWNSVGREAVDHLKALLRMDTSNPPGNEGPAIDYLAKVLTDEAIDFVVLKSDSGRPNLIARLKGSGDQKPLLLNAHVDVVPADAQAWDHPPFAAVEADGCIWGRGAIDMKHMVVECLMTMILVKRQQLELDRDLIFAAVADEEAGSNQGSVFLVNQHPELVRAQYVLNEVGGYTQHFGDVRFYPIQTAEKGICWFEMTAHGPGGHGSMPQPGNAVVRLSQAVTALGKASLKQHNTPTVEAFISQLAQRLPFSQRIALPLLLQPALSPGVLKLLRAQDEQKATAISALLRNTISPTVFNAGVKVNVIPDRACVQVDGRIIPGQSPSEFLAEVQEIVGPDIDIKVLEEREGTEFSHQTPLFGKIKEVVERMDPGSVAIPFMIPGTTDSSVYSRLGATCYGFSPVRLDSDLDFASLFHGNNERIPVAGFKWGVQCLYEVVSEFCVKD